MRGPMATVTKATRDDNSHAGARCTVLSLAAWICQVPGRIIAQCPRLIKRIPVTTLFKAFVRWKSDLCSWSVIDARWTGSFYKKITYKNSSEVNHVAVSCYIWITFYTCIVHYVRRFRLHMRWVKIRLRLCIMSCLFCLNEQHLLEISRCVQFILMYVDFRSL